MKQNTQKLLTWLYAPDQTSESASAEAASATSAANATSTISATPTANATTAPATFTIDYNQLKLLLPNLTPGGRRSLVHYLKQKHLLRSERLGVESQLSLTPHGRDAIEKLFPALSARRMRWQGEWSVLIFINGPKGDPNFRYLRQLLLEHHALSLRRGVYLCPGEFPSQIMNELKQLYVGAVQVLTIDQWRFGDEQSLVEQHYKLSDVIEISSGISKEIEELLKRKKEQKGLTNKTKQQIFSVFDRLFDLLCQDPGLTHYYYPENDSSYQLLQKLQQLMT